MKHRHTLRPLPPLSIAPEELPDAQAQGADPKGAKCMIQFTVYGIPQPKGSTRAFYRPGMARPVVTSDNPRTKPWALLVSTVAQEHAGTSPPMEGPVFVALQFWLPRPKSLPKRITQHTKKPDLDKLVRAVLDGLTGIVFYDDAQVVSIVAQKGYTSFVGVKVTAMSGFVDALTVDRQDSPALPLGLSS